MSRFFVLPEEGVGPGGTIYFRRPKQWRELGWWGLYVGDQMFGTLHPIDNTWSGHSYARDSEFFNVTLMDGFATRYDAAKFVIKHHGYWMRHERELRDSIARLAAYGES